MIGLTHYTQEFYEQLNYSLEQEQAKFTSSINSCLEEFNTGKLSANAIVCIYQEGMAVGFFVLDTGAATNKLSDSPNAILLRSFSINPSYQGKGIARQALENLDNWIKEFYPLCNEVVLSVNVKNIRAYQLYLRSGFDDTFRTIQGKQGLQHIMSRLIKS